MPKKATGGKRGKSRVSEVVAFRLSKKHLKIIDKRIDIDPRYKTRGSYLRARVIYDITRKHVSHKPKPVR